MTTATQEPTTQAAPAPQQTANLPATVKPPEKALPPVPIGKHGVMLNSLESLWRFSHYVLVGGFAPKDMERQESVAIAIQLGLELGLPPMAALQNIAVINGRPGIFGDAALALVRASGLLDEYREWYEVDNKVLKSGEGHPRTPTAKEVQNDTCTCYVLSKRVGAAEAMVTGFSTGDAKAAFLWDPPKGGPWKTYPGRMLKWRARGFNLRDNFGDVLKGMRTTEELNDEPLVVEATVPNGPPLGRNRIGKNGNGTHHAPQSEPIDASYTMPDGTHVGMDETVKPDGEVVQSDPPHIHVPGEEPGADAERSGQVFDDTEETAAAARADMDKRDVFDALWERIGQAEGKKDLEAIGADMMRHRELLGVHYDALSKRYQERYTQLTPPKPAPAAKPAKPSRSF